MSQRKTDLLPVCPAETCTRSCWGGMFQSVGGCSVSRRFRGCLGPQSLGSDPYDQRLQTLAWLEEKEPPLSQRTPAPAS